MERFRGILICTTNRISELDEASIRQFNYKIGFNYPVASDVIDDHGNVSHCMIVPADLGCINPKCKKEKT